MGLTSSPRAPQELRIGTELSELVGSTRLIALRKLGDGLEAELVAKLVGLNPDRSVEPARCGNMGVDRHRG